MKQALMRSTHWVMQVGENEPPPLPAGPISRSNVKEAARFAIRAATRNGTELDFDPDGLIIDLVNALFPPDVNVGIKR